MSTKKSNGRPLQVIWKSVETVVVSNWLKLSFLSVPRMFLHVLKDSPSFRCVCITVFVLYDEVENMPCGDDHADTYIFLKEGSSLVATAEMNSVLSRGKVKGPCI